MKDSFTHNPVLLQQALHALDLQTNDKVADLTFGLGGHSYEILKKIDESGTLYAFDKDSLLLDKGKGEFKKNNIVWVNDSYANIGKHIPKHSLNAVLADLGVSSYHFDDPERGFSFSKDGSLDMRLNPKTQKLTAYEIINTYSEEQLTEIFKKYGEEQKAKKISQKIKQQTKTKAITSTVELADLVSSLFPPQRKLHPATKIFQALRIYINEELGDLAKMLESLPDVLAPGAKVAIISFHSLEDRIVKQYFKRESTDCICDKKLPVCVCNHNAQFKLITKKPIIPDAEEIRNNPRARSAKMRVVQKI